MNPDTDKEKLIKWTYEAAPESIAAIKLEENCGLFIDGKFVRPQSRSNFDTINPATGKKLSSLAKAGPKDVELAVNSSLQAYNRTWRKMDGREIGKYLYRIARMIQERSRELAIVESMDNGKPIRESRDFDLPAAAAHFFYYAGWADKLDYAFPKREAQPLGVAAAIIPWNFPLLMAAWKIAPALACGNTIVLKPAENTSLSALKLGEIIRDCDLPPGVVNIITGAGDTGESLATSPNVHKLAFTGSTKVGKHLLELLAHHKDKKISLELGGKAAHIILDDAPIDQAVEGIINGIFFNQGHV